MRFLWKSLSWEAVAPTGGLEGESFCFVHVGLEAIKLIRVLPIPITLLYFASINIAEVSDVFPNA